MLEGVRRELAVRYIDEGSKPLNEVASLLGFSATSAFSRWYRQTFKITALDRQHQLRSGRVASTR